MVEYPTSDKPLIEQLINLLFMVMCTFCLFNVPIFYQVHIKWRLMTFKAPKISQVLFVNCLWTCHVNKVGEDNFCPNGGHPLSVGLLSPNISYNSKLGCPSKQDTTLYQTWRSDWSERFVNPWNVQLIYEQVWIKNLMNSENFKAECLLLSKECKSRLDKSWIDKILDNTDIHGLAPESWLFFFTPI